MTGRQHAAIGIGTVLPVGVVMVTGLLPAAWLVPGWPIRGAVAEASGMVGLLAGWLVVGGGLLGALMPDLDTDRSLLESAPLRILRRLWRRRWWLLWLLLAPLLLPLAALLAILNWLVMRLTSHRGATHGLAALAIVTGGGWALTDWALGPALALGLGVGYTSHLIADLLTPAGVRLGAPWSDRRWHLLPRGLRFGGESWLAGCLTSLVLLSGLIAAGWLLWRFWRSGA